MLGWKAVEGLDWSRLLHAYGPAIDTPSHLQALTGDPWEAQLWALDHLAYSVVHQYSVYPVTPFAVRVVAGLLDHSALRRRADDKPLLLAEVLDFFDDAAYSVSGAGATATTELLWEEIETTPEDVAGYFEALANHDIDLPANPRLDQLWEWSMADLQDALAELVDVILPLSEDHDPTVRTRSICLLTRLAGVPTVNSRAPELTSYFSSRVEATKSRDERAALVVGVGEVGGDTSAWLRDADESIRACAAVYLPGDPAATAVLQAALCSPTAISDWFTEQPWRQSGVSETLLRELVSRDLAFADLLPVALAIAKNAEPSGRAGIPKERDGGRRTAIC